MPGPPLSRSLVLSLPHAAEVRTRTLQQSDNIPPSDNAINEAEFTYNTQHAALRFSARRAVWCAKRAPLCQRRLWRGSPAGQPLEPSQTNDTRNASTTPTSPACLTLLMLTMPANTTTSTLSSPLRVKMLFFRIRPMKGLDFTCYYLQIRLVMSQSSVTYMY